MTGAGTGRVAEDTAAPSLLTSDPTSTRPACPAARSASRGLILPSDDMYAHWSGYGSSVPGSTKTVLPSSRAGLNSGAVNQVADPAGREQILGREQPVVARQLHPPAQRHRLP